MKSSGKQRLRVLVFIDWYLPAIKAGGPVRSLEAIIGRLAEDADFTVITSDSDAGSVHPLSGIETDKWTKAPDGTKIFYCSAQTDPVGVAEKLLQVESYDCLYINSVFSYRFAIRPIRKLKHYFPGKRTILAPRGMLGAGALQIKSTKKRLFITAAKWTGMFCDILWHVSSEQEAKEVRSVFGNDRAIVIAPNLASLSGKDLSGRSKSSGILRLVFLSRISPKKNLLLAIESLRSVSNATITLDVYGPEEDEQYAAECKVAARDLPSNIVVRFNGPYERSQIQEIFSDKHFMILPTHHENFGHVIIESLAFACPVILSRFTPWQNLDEQKAGMNCDLTAADFTKAIEVAAALSEADYNEWEKGALNSAAKFLSDDKARAVMLNMFRNATDRK